jgi:hypothetical protein
MTERVQDEWCQNFRFSEDSEVCDNFQCGRCYLDDGSVNEAALDKTPATVTPPATPSPSDEGPKVSGGPSPFSQGTYALFNTKKGGIHLVYRASGTEDDTHLDIPPMVVKMAQKAADGKSGGSMMSKMMGMGR